MTSSDDTGRAGASVENKGNNISGSVSGVSVQVGRVEGDAVIMSDFRRDPSSLHSLPAPPLSFIGRTREVQELSAHISPGEKNKQTSPVTVFRGMGGVGKTALALKIGAFAQQKGWFCAELFVDLRGFTPGFPPRSAEEVLGVLLRAMGYPPDSIPVEFDEIAALYRSSLQTLTDGDKQNRPVLVVADNASSVTQVRPLIPGPGGHQLLLTSRADMARITGARYVDLNVLSESESVELIATVLRTANPADKRCEFGDDLVLLSRKCGYLPLALDVCGAMLVGRPTSTPKRLAEKLSRRHKILNLVDGQDHTIQAVLDVSFERLKNEQKKIFALLGSIYGPDINTAAVAALSGIEEEEVEDILYDLASVHLIEAENERWPMHDLIRTYSTHVSSERLDEGERNAALDRLLHFYADHTEAAASHLGYVSGCQKMDTFAGRDTALEWLDYEWVNLFSMALIAQISGPNLRAVDLSRFLFGYLGRRRHLDFLLALARISQESSRALGDKEKESDSWAGIGMALQGMGNLDEAAQAIDMSHNLKRHKIDPISNAAKWLNLGSIHSARGEFEKAIDAQTKARDFLRRAGDARNEAGAWTNIGLTFQRAQRFEEAIRAHTKACLIFRAEGESYGEAMALYNLGLVLHEIGRFQDSVNNYSRSIFLYDKGGDREHKAEVLCSLGDLLKIMGRHGEADEAHSDARDIFLDISRSGEQGPIGPNSND